MRLVVIGGVAAGLSAAARARRCDPSLEIVVLEKTDAIAWGACGLPYFLEGQVRSLDELVMHTPERFARERNIGVRTGAEAAAIEHSRRQVVLAGGERIGYDRLVIAAGAHPDTAGIRGADQPHVFTLATMADARRIQEFLRCRRPRRAAIIGAGYLGLEMAEVLRTHGLQVALFEAAGEVLGRGDPALTDAVARHLKRCRVELRLGSRVTAIEPDRAGDFPCDMAVLAAGFKPNVGLAADAGIALGRSGAIAVDDRMETNRNGVYAAGDCAETTHLVTGRPVWIPLGTTANKMGRVAGANAAGRRERFPGVAGTLIVRVCGLGVGVTGLSAAQARKEGFEPASARIEASEKDRYFRGAKVTVELVADRSTRRILGGTVVGEQGVSGRVNVIAAAVTARMRLEDFAQLDLAYAPPYASARDPLLIAAWQLAKELD